MIWTVSMSFPDFSFIQSWYSYFLAVTNILLKENFHVPQVSFQLRLQCFSWRVETINCLPRQEQGVVHIHFMQRLNWVWYITLLQSEVFVYNLEFVTSDIFNILITMYFKNTIIMIVGNRVKIFNTCPSFLSLF